MNTVGFLCEHTEIFSTQHYFKFGVEIQPDIKNLSTPLHEFPNLKMIIYR
jgi:hypothetical protein